MKKAIFSIFAFILTSSAYASCVDWHQVWECEQGQVYLMKGQSWCGGLNREFYQLNIVKDHALEHLAKTARTEKEQFRALSLEPTYEYGEFNFELNTYVFGQVKEDHNDRSMTVSLNLLDKKIGEYRFSDCSF